MILDSEMFVFRRCSGREALWVVLMNVVVLFTSPVTCVLLTSKLWDGQT